MAGVSEQQILDALKEVIDSHSGKDIVSAGMVAGLQTKDGHVAFAIEVDPARGAEMEPLRKEAEEAVYDLDGVISATVVQHFLDIGRGRTGRAAAPAAPAAPGALAAALWIPRHRYPSLFLMLD